MPQAPKWIANVTARYGIPVGDGEWFVYTDWAYRSKVSFFLYQSVEYTGKPWVEGGLRVGYDWAGCKRELARPDRRPVTQMKRERVINRSRGKQDQHENRLAPEIKQRAGNQQGPFFGARARC